MKRDPVIEQVDRVISGHGYTLWGSQWRQGDGGPVLQVFCDDPERGITSDACYAIAKDLLPLMTVSYGHARVEVSSPGVDRVFFEWAQLMPYIGQTVRCTIRTSEGLVTHQGLLECVENDHLVLKVEDVVQTLKRDTITCNQLVPSFTRGVV